MLLIDDGFHGLHLVDFALMPPRPSFDISIYFDEETGWHCIVLDDDRNEIHIVGGVTPQDVVLIAQNELRKRMKKLS